MHPDRRFTDTLRTLVHSVSWPCRGLAVLLTAFLLGYSSAGLAQTQSADAEYYLQPVPGGASSAVVDSGGLTLSNALSGVNLTFNTGGFFARDFVAQTPIGVDSAIAVSIPEFAGALPSAETQFNVIGGSVVLISDVGEIIEVNVAAGSHITLVPYPLVPRVLFYELALIPDTTTVTPASPAVLSMTEIKTWGILVTNGSNFSGSWAFGQNQQFKASVTF